ncbi:dipeptidase PepE [Paraburkholderia acidisoli]|uniref:Dipeptidase PepE n=1 Tax=Paraburkholderia acidisoli TaxID=2571748 RepID=A0A7Z2JK77_9BURK|nr:dipeptidase PepE [Paraburkholderia acidisoli]QGZ66155.1 dipeptidase PepE [Paraburkholderia acidisoli]
MNALLLSNSRGPDGAYLVHALDAIRALTPSGGQSQTEALFVPFAGVTMTWDDYAAKVAAALAPAHVSLRSVHTFASDAEAQAAIAKTQLIVVGGGNTFQLLAQCRSRGFVEAIRQAVRGGARYLGWSAGANLACPTISTTNDMPIVDPQGFGALDLVDFQINPHYTNALPAGHQGETRNQRIEEYLAANPQSTVLGLPEGDWLQVAERAVTLRGPHEAVWFAHGAAPRALTSGEAVPGAAR